MRIAQTLLGLFTATALALSPRESPAAEPGAFHTGTGIVLLVDVETGYLRMTEEPSGTHILLFGPETKIVDEEGTPISADILQPGDLIREECLVVDHRAPEALQIHLLRPAWMEIASPEL